MSKELPRRNYMTCLLLLTFFIWCLTRPMWAHVLFNMCARVRASVSISLRQNSGVTVQK